MFSNKFILNIIADWDIWIFIIQIKTIEKKIWDMINSFLSMKTLSFFEFILFNFFVSNDSESFASYHFKKEHYKILISRYNKIVREFDEINALIQKIIFDVNQFYIKRFNIHFYDIFLILQKKTFSFDYERLMTIEANYHRIRKDSKNQNVKRWLNEWMKMFNNAKIYDFDEVAENKSLRDFLLVVKSIDSKFNSIHTINFLKTIHVSTTMKQMHDLIEKFKHTIRMFEKSKASFKSHFAFFFDDNSISAFIFSFFNVKFKNENNRSSFRRKSVESFQCVCEKKHWFSECFYINSKSRISDWKSDSQIQKKITEALKNKKFKEKVKRVLKKNTEFEKKIKSENDKTSKSENKSDDNTSELKDFFTVISTFFFFRSYEFVFSFSQSHELFFFFRSHELFFFFRFHELFFSFRSYKFRSF